MRYPIANYVSYENFNASHKTFWAAITKVAEPKYFQEVVKDPLWRKAMAEEIRAMEENKRWIVEDLPPGYRSSTTQTAAFSDIRHDWLSRAIIRLKGLITMKLLHLSLK